MTILFFGSDPWFSPPVFEALVKAGHQVPIVVTKGDSIGKWKVESGKLKVIQGKTANDISVSKLKSLLGRRHPAPGTFIVASFGPPFLSREHLDWPNYGALNVHASLLPRWRGASPVFAALNAGDQETGVTIMRMTEEVDRGPILEQRRTRVRQPLFKGSSLANDKDGPSYDTRETLTKKLAKLGGKLLVETLRKLENDQISETPQLRKSPTLVTRRLTKQTGQINWSKSPEEVERFIRAVTPWPGAWAKAKFKLKNSKFKIIRIIILKAHLIKSTVSAKGRSSSGRSGQGSRVNLVIDQVQLAGKNPISWKQLVAGHPGVKLC